MVATATTTTTVASAPLPPPPPPQLQLAKGMKRTRVPQKKVEKTKKRRRRTARAPKRTENIVAANNLLNSVSVQKYYEDVKARGYHAAAISHMVLASMDSGRSGAFARKDHERKISRLFVEQALKAREAIALPTGMLTDFPARKAEDAELSSSRQRYVGRGSAWLRTRALHVCIVCDETIRPSAKSDVPGCQTVVWVQRKCHALRFHPHCVYKHYVDVHNHNRPQGVVCPLCTDNTTKGFEYYEVLVPTVKTLQSHQPRVQAAVVTATAALSIADIDVNGNAVAVATTATVAAAAAAAATIMLPAHLECFFEPCDVCRENTVPFFEILERDIVKRLRACQKRIEAFHSAGENEVVGVAPPHAVLPNPNPSENKRHCSLCTKLLSKRYWIQWHCACETHKKQNPDYILPRYHQKCIKWIASASEGDCITCCTRTTSWPRAEVP